MYCTMYWLYVNTYQHQFNTNRNVFNICHLYWNALGLYCACFNINMCQFRLNTMPRLRKPIYQCIPVCIGRDWIGIGYLWILIHADTDPIPTSIMIFNMCQYLCWYTHQYDSNTFQYRSIQWQAQIQQPIQTNPHNIVFKPCKSTCKFMHQ